MLAPEVGVLESTTLVSFDEHLGQCMGVGSGESRVESRESRVESGEWVGLEG